MDGILKGMAASGRYGTSALEKVRATNTESHDRNSRSKKPRHCTMAVRLLLAGAAKDQPTELKP